MLSRAFRVCVIKGLCLIPSLGFSQPSESVHDSLYRQILAGDNNHMSCYFTYPQNNSTIIPELNDNAEELSRLNDFIHRMLSVDSLSISHIRLTGYCSIEGDYRFNSQLARQRVESFHDYLCTVYPLLRRYPIDLASVPEDWQTLNSLVKTSDMPEREEVLAIIRDVSSTEVRKKNLHYLNGERAYRYMQENIFPRLRRVEIIVEYDRQAIVHWLNTSREIKHTPTTHDPLIYNVLNQNKEKTFESAHIVHVDRKTTGETLVTFTTPSLKEEQGTVEVTHRTDGKVPLPSLYPFGQQRGTASRFALKTNLLIWAGVQSDFDHTTLIPNLAIEYFLTPRWSVEAGAKYSNWHHNNHRQFQGISGYRLELRHYLLFPTIHNPYITPYLGVYTRLGDYNMQPSRAAYPPLEGSGGGTGFTGKYHDFGFSTGFHLRLYRDLGLELGVRAGYVCTRPTAYNLHNDHNCYDHESLYDKFRITDVNLNLVYRFR